MPKCGECGKHRDCNPDTDNCSECDALIASKHHAPVRAGTPLDVRARLGGWNPHFLSSLKENTNG